MKKLTQSDVEWLGELLVIMEYIHAEYPELFTKDDEETLAIARELIRSLQ